MKLKTKLEKQIANDGDNQRWGSVEDVERLFALKRSMAYYLIGAGKIKSRLIRIRGSHGTGRRLIDMRSVEKYIESCPLKPTKTVSRRTRNAALRSAAVRAAFAARNGRRKR